MPYQVVDQYRTTADSQGFPYEPREIIGLQVMREEVTTNQVVLAIAKGKSESVGHQRSTDVDMKSEVSSYAVQQSNVEPDAALRETLGYNSRNVTRPGGHFQERKVPSAAFMSHPLDQRMRCRDSAEPAIHAAQIAECDIDFRRRPSVGIQQLRCIDPFHADAVFGKPF